MPFIFSATLTLALWFSPLAIAEPANAAPVPLTYSVLESKPHDTNSFTQGLVQLGDTLVETSGLHNKSFVMRYDIASGKVLQKARFPGSVFAEGVTHFNNKLYALSWQSGQLFEIDLATFEPKRTHTYQGEGWGITHNGQWLITSDGSERLTFRDARDFSTKNILSVKDGNRHWKHLNELEYAQDFIWANVWLTPYILAINPDTGDVEGIADLSDLVKTNNHQPGRSVLNGIAYDAASNSFWVTGKLWPTLYRVQFHWPDSHSPAQPVDPG